MSVEINILLKYTAQHSYGDRFFKMLLHLMVAGSCQLVLGCISALFVGT